MSISSNELRYRFINNGEPGDIYHLSVNYRISIPRFTFSSQEQLRYYIARIASNIDMYRENPLIAVYTMSVYNDILVEMLEENHSNVEIWIE